MLVMPGNVGLSMYTIYTFDASELFVLNARETEAKHNIVVQRIDKE